MLLAAAALALALAEQQARPEPEPVGRARAEVVGSAAGVGAYQRAVRASNQRSARRWTATSQAAAQAACSSRGA